MLDGRRGPGTAMAMRMVVALAKVLDADRLIPVHNAHIDSCLYHGQAGLDFAQKLVDLGARVAVPTTLNVSSLDLMHPGLIRLPPEEAVPARALMDAYRALGARATWTCAPYQTLERPTLGRTLPGRNRTPLYSPTRCWVPGPNATATSLTSALPSPDAYPTPGCI